MTNLMIAILVVLLLILAVLVGGFLWIRAKIRGVFKSITDAVGDFAALAKGFAGMPDFRITMNRVDDISWWHGEQIEAWSAALREKGFVDAGDFHSGDGSVMKVRGLVHEEQRIVALLYDMEAASQIDLASDYEDGSGFVVTSMPESGVRKPPFATTVRLPGEELNVLYDKLISERPAREMKLVAADDFAEHVEAEYAREMNWRVDTGGYTDDEIRAVSGSDADKEVSSLARTMMQSSLAGGATSHLLEKYRGQFDPGVVPEGAEDYQFIVVLNIADADDLTGHLPDVDMEDDDYEKREARAKELLNQHGPRGAFAKLLEENPRGSEVRKLMSVTDPVEADIYLRPMDVEEEYE